MKCILMLLALFIILNVTAQTDEQQLYQHKIKQYTKTKNAGSTLCGAGILVTTIGVTALVVTQNDINYEEDDLMLAVYGIGLGIDMIIGGIILQTVGYRKVKQYQEKYDRLSASISVSHHSTGISLVYRF